MKDSQIRSVSDDEESEVQMKDSDTLSEWL